MANRKIAYTLGRGWAYIFDISSTTDRLEFSLMFAGAAFWKPPNARQAEHSDQTKTSGHASHRALARQGLQVGSAPKPDGRQKQGWCSNGAFQKPKHKPEVKF